MYKAHDKNAVAHKKYIGGQYTYEITTDFDNTRKILPYDKKAVRSWVSREFHAHVYVRFEE